MKYKTLISALNDYKNAQGTSVGSLIELLSSLEDMRVDYSAYPSLHEENLQNLKAHLEVLEYHGAEYLISDWHEVVRDLLEDKRKELKRKRK